MTFSEITRTMLTSMDFFELRRTAGRYDVPFQGVRRQQLIRDVEKQILAKSLAKKAGARKAIPKNVQTLAETAPLGATSAKPKLEQDTQRKVAARINTFSARAGFNRVQTR